MSIPRSKSTPHVFGGVANDIHTHQYQRPSRPRVPRSKSVLGSHQCEVASPTVTYSPSVEREDPFNLSNFFPSHLGFGERDDEWKWLQEETSHSERSPARSGYSTPFAEEDAWLPPTPPEEEIYEESSDEERTKAAIQKEDKLGILTFGGFLASRRAGNKYSEDRVLSPYSEYDLTDDEALYHALSALRASHELSTEREVSKQMRARFDELFVTEAAESILEGLNDGGYSLWHGGIRGAMDFFDTKF